MDKKISPFKLNYLRPTAIISIIAFILSVILRIAGYAGRLDEPLFAFSQVALPTCSILLMVMVMIRFGQKSLWLSIFPVILGVISFVFKLFIDPRDVSFLHHFAAIILYIAISALWGLTVLRIMNSKWPLVVLFLIPFIKHILLDDLPIILGMAPPLATDKLLMEFSMLLTMLALSLCALSFEEEE